MSDLFHFQKKTPSCVILVFLFFLALLPGAASEKDQPIVAYKTDIPPVIDGKLDDSVWQKAPSVRGFKTFHPDFGIDMVDDTIVYLAYDDENLYFGFRCFDSEPDKIKASVTSRDQIRADDWVGVNLDSFNDHQSLYALYCNPLGIQQDSRAEGGDEDYTVDVVWYTAGLIDDKGYVVEMKIPFKSIRFNLKNPVEMGVIFERQVSRRSVLGTHPPLDPKGANWFTQTMPFILPDVKTYRLFEVLPSVTYSHGRSLDEGRLVSSPGGVGDLSLTGKFGITPDLILDGTVNPDFSQIESDAGQVDFNLRYALFFPEKRPFFLEGLEKFNFGGYHGGDPLNEIVHTRTIVNPIAGFKLNGKIGEKDAVAALYAMDELLDPNLEKHAHFTIFRYKRSLAQDSFIGGIYTGKERTGGYNRVLGLDGQFRISTASVFGFHGFVSQNRLNDQASRDDGHALSLHFFSNTRNWTFMLGMQDIAEDFRTETGYINRTGLTRFRSGAVRKFYPQSKVLPRIDALVHSYHIVDKFSDLFETSNSLDVMFKLLRNSSVMVGYRYSTEVFLAERFNTSGLRLMAESQFTKDFFIRLHYNYKNKIRYVGNPYQGYGSDLSTEITFLPSENLHLNLSFVYSDFYRDRDKAKEYDYTIIRSRNVYQVNKYLFFRAIVEYNSFRKRLLTDFLASFTYIPGTVIHIGYGSLYERIQWVEGQYRPADNFIESQRGFFFKASYLWRF